MKQLNKINSVSYKTIFLVFGLIFAAIAMNAFYKNFYEGECVGLCTTNLNNQFNAEGSVLKREGSPTANLLLSAKGKVKKNKVFVIDYDTGFTIPSSKQFALKIDQIAGASIAGDIAVINITSPGGNALACSSDFNKLYSLRAKGVKVVATVDYAALSCGYYLAAAADTIIADSGAWVGNIGAVLVLPDQGKNKKTAIGSSRVKELLAGGSVNSKEDLKIFKNVATMSFNGFVADVIKGRGDKLLKENYGKAFSAYPFSGLLGKEIGLVDEIKTSSDYLKGLHYEGYRIIKINYVPKKTIVQKLVTG